MKIPLSTTDDIWFIDESEFGDNIRVLSDLWGLFLFYFGSTVSVCKIPCELLPFYFSCYSLISQTMPYERFVGLQCTAGGLHSKKVDAEGLWHLYCRECTSVKGHPLKISDIKLNSLEPFDSEPYGGIFFFFFFSKQWP